MGPIIELFKKLIEKLNELILEIIESCEEKNQLYIDARI
jgi:hypothetical protein